MADVASGWMSEFLDRVGTEVTAALAHAEVADIQRHFLFFFVDILRTALNRCLDAQRPRILELFNQAKNEIEQGGEITGAAQSISQIANPTDAELRCPPGGAWASIDTFDALVGLSLSSVFSASNDLLAPVADLFAQTGAPVTQERLANTQKKLLEILPNLKELMSVELHTLYREIARSLSQQIDSIQHQSAQATQTAIRQAHILHRATGPSQAEVEITLETIVANCTETRQRLHALRNQLWPLETEGS